MGTILKIKNEYLLGIRIINDNSYDPYGNRL